MSNGWEGNRRSGVPLSVTEVA